MPVDARADEVDLGAGGGPGDGDASATGDGDAAPADQSTIEDANGEDGAGGDGGVWMCPASGSVSEDGGGLPIADAGSNGCGVGLPLADGGPGDSPPSSGQPCDQPGRLGCNGANQKQTLICQNDRWQAFQTCVEGQSCDQTSGVCADIVPDCAARAPGEAFCAGDKLQRCGPDRVSLDSVQCCGTCNVAACQPPRCGDGKVEPGEECDDGNTKAGDGCEPECIRSAVLTLSAGLTHTCALLRGGRVRCWGGNEAGQLGLGNHDDVRNKKPFELGPIELCGRASAIAAGGLHTCALMANGTVQCWGDNTHGQLGLGHTHNIGDDEPPMPQIATVPLGAVAKAVAAGGLTTCAILEDGSLRCWGMNNLGQLGLGHTRDIGDDEVPTQANAEVSLKGKARAVGPGGDHSCAVLQDNSIRCWGRNDHAQLGLGFSGNVGDDELPDSVDPIVFTVEPNPFIKIMSGALHTCALHEDGGILHCWGFNGDGSLGLGFAEDRPWAKATDWGLFSTPMLGMSVGAFHRCLLRTTYDVRCWGRNDKAQLGLPNTNVTGSVFYVPNIDVGTFPNGNRVHVTSITAGALHTCAMLEGGDVRCWGFNGDGQLGLGYASLAPIDYVGGTPEIVPAKLPLVEVLPPKP